SNKCKIYIIGGKPQEKIKKIVEKNEMDNVFFPGLLRSNELRKYYACADLFVLCTREDIWGLVIQEAMSYGLPVSAVIIAWLLNTLQN
ncbi:MAG: glycosyltransferase family 4 protein, partial [Erysipelotrichaceae bacterium]|nr:glycosyltransferase family 4 protein [Erysipelotrichaceae bacterium]